MGRRAEGRAGAGGRGQGCGRRAEGRAAAGGLSSTPGMSALRPQESRGRHQAAASAPREGEKRETGRGSSVLIQLQGHGVLALRPPHRLRPGTTQLSFEADLSRSAPSLSTRGSRPAVTVEGPRPAPELLTSGPAGPGPPPPSRLRDHEVAHISLFSGITVMSIIIRAGVIFPLCPSGVGRSQLWAPKERSDAHISQLDLAKGVVSPLCLWGHSRCVAAAVAPCSGPAFDVALGSAASTGGLLGQEPFVNSLCPRPDPRGSVLPGGLGVGGRSPGRMRRGREHPEVQACAPSACTIPLHEALPRGPRPLTLGHRATHAHACACTRSRDAPRWRIQNSRIRGRMSLGINSLDNLNLFLEGFPPKGASWKYL